MRRGDGRLSLELDPQYRGPQDACGVFGVWARNEDVAKLTYFGLYALQHRGQEAAGMAVSDGSGIVVFKDVGLVAQVFDERTLASLPGHIAIGHTRYSTTGGGTWENAQPTLRESVPGSAGRPGAAIALAHNGNLVNTAELAREVSRLGLDGLVTGETSDTAIVASLLAAQPDVSVEEAAKAVLPRLKGAFSFTFMDENTLYGARDPLGIRPLVLGRLERGWALASETAALETIGASIVREIEPGELIAIDDDGLRATKFATPRPSGCVVEYVYLARPDTVIAGQNVYESRVAVGRTLAREQPAAADIVIPVPDSGVPAAVGYARESGIPFEMGLARNGYIGRTFIQPTQSIRQLGVRLKLNPMGEVLHGKRVVVVDDSMIRGNTQRAIVRMLRGAGATEVHVRIASPPLKWPCFYGIDMGSTAEFLSTGLDVDGVTRAIGADSVGHISMEGLVAASGQSRSRLCCACFDGKYPTELPPDGHGKQILEDARHLQ